MKAKETILVDFITDFNLELPGIGVCFVADIKFTTGSFFREFSCEVQIITMIEKHLSIIYLLHQELTESGIPDIFPFDPANFSYHKMKSLIVTDYDLLRGKYSLSISPIVNSCSQEPNISLATKKMI